MRRTISTNDFLDSVQKLLAPGGNNPHGAHGGSVQKPIEARELLTEIKQLLGQIDPDLLQENGAGGVFQDIDKSSLVDLGGYGINVRRILRNPPAAVLYEEALKNEEGTSISSSGALVCTSGTKTGRSPTDKRVVRDETTLQDVWWAQPGSSSSPNIPLESQSFLINRERAVDYLNTRKQLYVVDGFAGHDPRFRIRIRVICSRAYHALFMENMLVRPRSKEELQLLNQPDFVILNAGSFPANIHTKGMTSSTSICLDFTRKEMVILGSQYAGEMKKGVFTIMNYLMPRLGNLSLHSSCNLSKTDPKDVTLFFGLSGTGKTTLSADPHRNLIGDDEHVWTDRGVFNIEGGCYAIARGLKHEAEPEIFEAIRFGSVLENVVGDPVTRVVDFDNTSITENTRASYPLEFIPNAVVPHAITQYPARNIVMLSCDAFGVLPPVSRLSPEQAMFHFISGYTSKVAGTEQGIKEPTATFSACFGAPFLVLHPSKYATLLAEKMRVHNTTAWLVNTGWVGGSPQRGFKRIALKYTRAIIDAIHSGELEKIETTEMPIFGLRVPVRCPGVPDELMLPWRSQQYSESALRDLARRFTKNFEQFKSGCPEEIIRAGPQMPVEGPGKQEQQAEQLLQVPKSFA